MMRISIHATPGARRNHVGGSHNGALRVSVTVPADKGKANRAITKGLAKALGIRPTEITLISGQTSRRKVFEINANIDTVSEKLSELMIQ